jgi:hypothetical protein
MVWPTSCAKASMRVTMARWWLVVVVNVARWVSSRSLAMCFSQSCDNTRSLRQPS